MGQTAVKRVRDLTDDEIAQMKKDQLRSWLSRAMNRLWEILPKNEYHQRCECWACQQRLTPSAVREFLRWARDIIREHFRPKLAQS